MFVSATRRGLLGTVAASLGANRLDAATGVPESATLIAPGPEDGPLARYAALAARGLARGLVQAAAIRVTVVGAADGITAANRFAVATPADGRVLLALPGLAAQTLLVGDQRARFAPRQWPAVSGSLVPALVAGRGALGDGQAVRFAISGSTAPDAAGLLALDLLGRVAMPVMMPAAMAPEVAVTLGSADAVVLTGRTAPARAAALGLTPWFAFDGVNAARESGLADVPTLGELLADSPQPDLLAACRAAAAGLRVRALLVLPALTSADTVALWREAARRWTEAEPEAETRRVHGQDAAATLATLCPPPEVALAYRTWLLHRLAFQAG